MRKTNKAKMLLSFLLIMVVLSGQFVYADEAAKVDAPSAWAAFDIQMANVYKLGAQENYSQYTVKATGNLLSNIEASLYQTFKITGKTVEKRSGDISRKAVIQGLYLTSQEVLLANKKITNIDNSAEAALKYFVDKGLIKGKADGKYALEDSCSKQELLVFAKRAYEELVYALGLDAKGAFWKVSDEDNTVYLLGSIHATDGSVYPMSKAIMSAYDDAEVLAVEANILTVQQDMAYVQQKMMLEGSTTIDQLISKEAYDAYVAIVKPLGVAPEIYNKVKPWYAAMLVQSIQMMNANYEASLGIDLFFLSKAMNQKNIMELEGTKFQIDMFDSFSAKLQEQYLMGVLSSKESDTKDIIGGILSHWKSGNMTELAKLIAMEQGTTDVDKEFNEKMWLTRNNNMSDKVYKMLKEDKEKDYLVVVGAGHMLNDTGIVKQLIDKGYKVEQVLN